MIVDLFIFFSWLLAILVFASTFFLFVEVLVSIIPLKNTKPIKYENVKDSSAVIIVPAHNEEDVIKDTLLSIIPQLCSKDELIVVADNCSDKTAEIAAFHDAKVIIRNDDENRGKGFAIDYAVSHISDIDFDVVVIIDADCVISSGCRDALVGSCLTKNRPVQCLYNMTAQSCSPELSERISEFAWRIKNKLRPNGLRKLSGPCQLMGSGMAFPKEQLTHMKLATSCIVEDMKLGLDFVIRGNPPVFLNDCSVSSFFPVAQLAREGQKTRWVHGHLQMMGEYIPSVFKTALLRKDWQALLMFFDLMILPLMMLLFLNVSTVIFLLVLAVLTGSTSYFLGLISLLLVLITFLLGWLVVGRDLLAPTELVLGILNKVKMYSIYFSFFSGGLKSWNKTPRK